MKIKMSNSLNVFVQPMAKEVLIVIDRVKMPLKTSQKNILSMKRYMKLKKMMMKRFKVTRYE